MLPLLDEDRRIMLFHDDLFDLLTLLPWVVVP